MILGSHIVAQTTKHSNYAIDRPQSDLVETFTKSDIYDESVFQNKYQSFKKQKHKLNKQKLLQDLQGRYEEEANLLSMRMELQKNKRKKEYSEVLGTIQESIDYQKGISSMYYGYNTAI